MSDAVNSAPKTAEERAAALLAAGARAAHGRHQIAESTLWSLIEPDPYQLSEVERATVRKLLRRLIERIEAELRAELINVNGLRGYPELAASFEAAHVAIAWPILSRARVPDDQFLAQLLVRRSRAFTISRQLRRNAVTTENGRLETLTEHGDDRIAADARSLLVAESRTNDRFDDPHLGRRDLSQDVDNRMIWAVAAALREYAVRIHEMEPIALDSVIADTASAMIARRGKEESVESVAIRLAGLLHGARLVDDGLLVEALNSARLTLYIALLSVRAGMTFDSIWQMATLPDAPSHMLVLKSLDVDRLAASHLLLAMDRALSVQDRFADERVASWVETYDALEPVEVQRAVQPWRLGAAFRDAIAAVRASDAFDGVGR